MDLQQPTRHDRYNPPIDLPSLLVNLVFPPRSYSLPFGLRYKYGQRLYSIVNTLVDEDYDVITDAAVHGWYTFVDENTIKIKLEELLFVLDVEIVNAPEARMGGAACPGMIEEGLDSETEEDVLGRVYLRNAGEVDTNDMSKSNEK